MPRRPFSLELRGYNRNHQGWCIRECFVDLVYRFEMGKSGFRYRLVQMFLIHNYMDGYWFIIIFSSKFWFILVDIQTDLPQDPNSTIAALTNLLSAKLPSKGEPFPKIRGPSKDDHVCIVGAGTAGIHMAVSLKDKGYKKITIFEKSSRVGGKCYDVRYDEFYQPIGAVFLQVDYFNTVVELAKRYNVGDIQAISMIGVSHEKVIIIHVGWGV